MIIDVTECPDATEDTGDRHHKCRECGKNFVASGIGRPSVRCNWFRGIKNAQAEKNRQERRDAPEGTVPVNLFKSYKKAKELRKGDIVYVLSKLFLKEISQRRYASEYRVTRVTEDVVYIIRNQKSDRVHEYEVAVTDISRLNKPIGVTYVKKESTYE